MEHVDSEVQLSKEELEFNELIRHGDDFLKIEIFRNARRYYAEALETHMNDELVRSKIADCDQKIKKESKIIFTIVAIAAVIVGIVCLIKFV